MPSPFPTSSSHPGRGSIHLTLLPPSAPTFSRLEYTYPLKLLPSVPHILPPQTINDSASKDVSGVNSDNAPHSERSDSTGPPPTPAPQPSSVPLLFMLTYGGGLVAGDCIDLDIKLDRGTRLTLTTQGSTKIFRPASTSTSSSANQASSSNTSLPSTQPPPSNPTPPPPPPTTHQNLTINIAPHAALWLAPDPIQPFAHSLYTQTQTFNISRSGSLGLVDWVTEGRKAMGESWSFNSWRGRNEVWEVWSDKVGVERRRLLVRDAVILDGKDIRGRMDGKGVFGTVILRGPLFEHLGKFFAEEFEALPRIGGRNWGNESDAVREVVGREKWRNERIKREEGDGVLWTVGVVRGVVRGCTVVKFAAREVEGARGWLGGMVGEEGSVGREFGMGGLMFVK